MPSNSKVYPVRLNSTYEDERLVIGIIDTVINNGGSLRKLVVQCILQCQGYDPRAFQQSSDASISVAQMESLLEQFAEQIIKQVGARGASATDNDTRYEDDDEEVSPLARNLVKGYLQRRKQVFGEGDE